MPRYTQDAAGIASCVCWGQTGALCERYMPGKPGEIERVVQTSYRNHFRTALGFDQATGEYASITVNPANR